MTPRKNAANKPEPTAPKSEAADESVVQDAPDPVETTGITVEASAVPDTSPSALAAALEGLGDVPDEESDEEAIPDADLDGMQGTPMIAPERAPEVEERNLSPTNATIARELSAFKKYTGDAQKIVIFFQDDLGKHHRINEYRSAEMEAYGSVDNFVQKVLVKKYGPGTYPVVGVSANGKEYNLKPVAIAVPIENERTNTAMEMQQQLLQRTEQLTDQLLDARTQRAEQPDGLAVIDQFERLKKLSGGDPMMMMMFQQMSAQGQQRGPDPSVAALTDFVKDLARDLKDMRAQALQPPLTLAPTGPTFEQTMLIEMMKGQNARPAVNPLDDAIKMRQILAPAEGAMTVEKMMTTWMGTIMSHQPTPLKELAENYALIKKMNGDENAGLYGLFRDLIKTPGFSSLAGGIADAIRTKNGARALPQNAQSAPTPTPSGVPPFPAGYLDQHTAALTKADTDEDLVQAIVQAILALASDEQLKGIPERFFDAAVDDNVSQTTQILFGLFDAWRKQGATLSREKADQVIRAVTTSWDIIVEKVCGLSGKPLPATLAKRKQLVAEKAARPEPAPVPKPAPAVHLVPSPPETTPTPASA